MKEEEFASAAARTNVATQAISEANGPRESEAAKWLAQ